jgi:hypothetical protein
VQRAGIEPKCRLLANLHRRFDAGHDKTSGWVQFPVFSVGTAIVSGETPVISQTRQSALATRLINALPRFRHFSASTGPPRHRLFLRNF